MPFDKCTVYTGKQARYIITACTHLYDKSLIKRGQDPTQLRTTFYKLPISFQEEKLTSTDISEILKLVPGFSKYPYIIFTEISEPYERRYSCGSCGDFGQDYFLLYKEYQQFHICSFRKYISTYRGDVCNEFQDNYNYEIIEPLCKTNSLILFNKFTEFTLTISETFGHKEFIKSIPVE